MKIKLGDFAGAISARLWQSVSRANWRTFEAARAFVHALQLKSRPAWREYCDSGNKPADIPFNPDTVYATEGWLGYGDWLGTGRIADHLREYRSFKKARAFVRSLSLKSSVEWTTYCTSRKKPADIPAHPNGTYAHDGWAG